MSLEADIARIAAMRGKLARNYQVRARQVHSSEVRGLFRMAESEAGDVDLRAFDALPKASRRALSQLPLQASALKYAELLLRTGDEDCLIDALEDQAPGIIHDWAMRHYGPDHPTARKLA